ncbi:Piso0_005683 [Millerozyma farinosa CBS 7064]|uniref:peptidylprolyl isomerase n=1 Tax=Pichia sorbitophila (strain ATCC MYA-4447 / BCRC 22081 / CBS 7064 / NBRC 10061 / NRRL Y-12695) TaxID=559304 RepID=G8Y2M7_PICSO|nr:Piso0_005683 [Millerozyma farinosa CBS 7064]
MKLTLHYCLLFLFGTAVLAAQLKIDVLESVPSEKCTKKAKSGDLASVHYEGSLEDGTVFDSSFRRNQPISFRLGSGQVIEGWDKGLIDMCVGEKRKLTIPPELGYGDRGIGPIPPKATLVFTTELVDVVDISNRDEL